jgi:hypothetical protein
METRIVDYDSLHSHGGDHQLLYGLVAVQAHCGAVGFHVPEESLHSQVQVQNVDVCGWM